MGKGMVVKPTQGKTTRNMTDRYPHKEEGENIFPVT